MRKSKITATASYLPPTAVSNEDLCAFVDTTDEWILSRTGIKNRNLSKEENTSGLCIRVARKLLLERDLKASDLDAIIVATISPDYLTPSTACLVQGEINAYNAVAFDIGAACTGFIYALSVADKFIRAGAYSKIMVLGGETLSKIVDWADRRTCVLFGDGCAGVLLEAGEYGICTEVLESDGKQVGAMYGGFMPVRNFLVPDNGESIPFLQMDGRAIFEFATKAIPRNIEQLLQKANLNKNDISKYILHQANARIIKAIAKKLDLPQEKFYINIEKYGNTSAASIPIALDELVKTNACSLGSHEKIVLAGFGAGLTYGSILIEI